MIKRIQSKLGEGSISETLILRRKGFGFFTKARMQNLTLKVVNQAQGLFENYLGINVRYAGQFKLTQAHSRIFYFKAKEEFFGCRILVISI